MKTTRFFLFAAAALVLAASCQKNEMLSVEKAQSSSSFRITGTLEKPVGTRATMIGDKTSGFKAQFEIGDTISVFNKVGTPGASADVNPTHEFALFVVTDIDGNGKATFEPASEDYMAALDSTSNDYYAAFGGLNATNHRFSFMQDTGKVASIIPTNPNPNCTGAENINKYFTQVARAQKQEDGTINFNFVNVAGLVKVTIPEGAEITKILFTGEKDNKPTYSNRLSSYTQIELDENGNFVSQAKGDGKNIGGFQSLAAYFNTSKSSKPAEGYNVFPAGDYYIPVYPDTKIAKVTVYSGSNATTVVKAVTPSKDLTVKRGQIKDLGYCAPFINVSSDSVVFTKFENHQINIPIESPAEPSLDLSEGLEESWLTVIGIQNDTLKLITKSNNEADTIRTGTITLTLDSVVKTIRVYQKPTTGIGLPYTGTDSITGIKYWVDPENPKHFKIVSPKQLLTQFTIKDNKKKVYGFTGAMDAKARNQLIRNLEGFPNDYPAAAYCYNLGEEWLLPKKSDAWEIMRGYLTSGDWDDGDLGEAYPKDRPVFMKVAMLAFDTALLNIGGDKLNNQADDKEGDAIWTLEEDTEKKKLKLFYMGLARDKKIYGYDSEIEIYARCIREYTLE